MKYFLCLNVVIACVTLGRAQNETDLAHKTQNPVSDLISLPFQNNTSFNMGPNNQTQNVLNIQPVWPLNLSDSLS